MFSKRIYIGYKLAFIGIIVLCLAMSSCPTQLNGAEKESADIQTAPTMLASSANTGLTSAINRIGLNIEERHEVFALFNDSFIYVVFGDGFTTLHRYYFETQKDILITEMNNLILYTSLSAIQNEKLYFHLTTTEGTVLYSLDLNTNSLTALYTQEIAYPRVMIAPFQNKLIILKTIETGGGAGESGLYAYDTETGREERLMFRSANYTARTGAVLDSFSWDNNNLYVVEQSRGNDGALYYQLNVYNSELQLTKVIDLNPFKEHWNSAIVEIHIYGDYIFFHCIMGTSFLCKMEGDTLRLIHQDYNFELASGAQYTKDIGALVFFKRDTNNYYVLELESGKFSKVPFALKSKSNILMAYSYNENLLVIVRELVDDAHSRYEEYMYTFPVSHLINQLK